MVLKIALAWSRNTRVSWCAIGDSVAAIFSHSTRISSMLSEMNWTNVMVPPHLAQWLL
ncbi:MAG: hypothetical protein ACJ8LN_17540 [Sulfurifustis sp.]